MTTTTSNNGGTGEKELKTTEDTMAKPFKLPCLTKLGDLMQKFSGQLEINLRNRNRHIKVDSPKSGKNITLGCSIQSALILVEGDDDKGRADEHVTRRRNSRGSSSRASNSGDSQEDIQFQTRTPKRVAFKRTPKLRSATSDDDEEDELVVPTKTFRPEPRSKSSDNDDCQILGSAIVKPTQPQKKACTGPGRTRGGKGKQQESKVNGQYVFGGTRIKPTEDVINTHNFVDEAMILYLPEICKRFDVELVKDPLELCSKFSLVLPDINLMANEIECIDMTS